MRKQSGKRQTCRRCLMTSDCPGLTFDDSGICRLCRLAENGIRRSASVERSDAYLQDFEATLERNRGKVPYDALLCISGGKDSAYLAYLLKEKYGLNILTYHMQTVFEAPLAAENLAQVVGRMDLPLRTFAWSEEFSRTFYSYFLTHPLQKGLTGTICRICQLALISSAVRLAQRERIPLVLLGYSPFQAADRWQYEISPETFIAQFRVFDEFWDVVDIAPAMRDAFYFPAMGTELPRLLLPLHALPYPSEDAVREVLERQGLLSAGRVLPRRTKCDLVWLMARMDTIHFNDPPYRDLVSEKIRKGEASRWKWRLALPVFHALCRLRIFKRRHIQRVLRKLGLSEGQILAGLAAARESGNAYRDVFRMDPSRDLLDDHGTACGVCDNRCR